LKENIVEQEYRTLLIDNELRNRMGKDCIKEISDDIHAGIIQLIEILIVIKI
jgi:hypothetical protein